MVLYRTMIVDKISEHGIQISQWREICLIPNIEDYSIHVSKT